jgi:hypothetical protein
MAMRFVWGAGLLLAVAACGGGDVTAPTTGTLEIVTATSGNEPDADGYTIQVDGGPAQPIGANGTLTIDALSSGSHVVQLGNAAANCVIAGANPRPVDIAAGAQTALDFAVSCGASGTLLRWEPMTSGTAYHLTSVWGSSSTNVYAVGESGGGWNGRIFHYDGQGWSQVFAEPGITLLGVWGSGSNDVFAVGGGGPIGLDGVIRHYDGRSWSPINQALGLQAFLLSVWGLASTDIFAVGEHFESLDRALLTRGNGSTWTKMALAQDAERIVKDVHGTSAHDVYAVGYLYPASGSFILHYDGTQWTEVVSREGQELLSGVWANSPTDVFAVGTQASSGLILHYDGHTWSPMDAPAGVGFNDIWGSSGSDVYAVGNGIAHYDGKSWTKVSDQWGNAVWGSSATDVFVVGPDGTILHGAAGK